MINPVDGAIVGGGLSGMLLALKLSRSEHWKEKTLTLIEEQTTLGGRLFFDSSSAPSGFGFEIFDLQTKESLFRHIQNLLTEQERESLENHLSQFQLSDTSVSRSFFVKKEFTSAVSLLNGTNELLTKKESEYLKSIVDGANSEKDVNCFKGDLGQIVSLIVGLKWESLPFAQCCEMLKSFFQAPDQPHFLPFERLVGLEKFLQKILEERGIQIRTGCRVVRMEPKGKEGVTLILSNEQNPQEKTLFAKKAVLTIPLTKTAGLFPKENYSPEQSKFVSKVQPMSLVVYELSHFNLLKNDLLSYVPQSYDRLYFPVEKVKSFFSCDDRALFYTELDYEDSLQAPSVREAVTRLKKAAGRLLKEDIQKEMKKGFRMPQSQFSERVILLPVAQSVPYFTKPNLDLKQGQMKAPALLCCGDSFLTLADEPWKRVLHSVNEIAHLLN